MNNYLLGLDIGGTKCAVVLAKACPGIQLIDKIRFDTHTELGFDYTYRQLCESMERILNNNALDVQCVRAIGISCGGPLDSKKGIVLCPPNLPGWENIPICELLNNKYGIPVYIQNDAKACALVEWKLGAGRGSNNMVFLTMGTGMGAGIIAEGKLLCGASDMGGEIGHLRLTDEGPVGFGKAGSFEGWTSGGGIARQAAAITKEILAQGREPAWIRDGCSVEEIDCKRIAEYAREGDEDAKALFQTVGTMLGRGIALLVDTLNPDAIVIGSIFQRCEDLLRESMEAALSAEAISYSLSPLKIVPAEMAENLGDYASVITALYAEDIDLNSRAEEKKPLGALSNMPRV